MTQKIFIAYYEGQWLGAAAIIQAVSKQDAKDKFMQAFRDRVVYSTNDLEITKIVFPKGGVVELWDGDY